MRHMTWSATLVSLAASAYSADVAEIKKLKEMYLDTELAAKGQAKCLIAAPDEPQYAALAKKLASAIKDAYGAAPPVMPASQISDEDMKATNIIALGIFSVNRVTEKLYLRELVRYDYNWPDWEDDGRDDYVIRTVHNPWLTGKNVVFIGSKHVTGCQIAVERFVQIIRDRPDGSVGPLIEVVRNGERPAAPTNSEVASGEKRIDQKWAEQSFRV